MLQSVELSDVCILSPLELHAICRSPYAVDADVISGMSNRFVSSANYHHHRHHQQRHLFDQYPRLRHHCRHRHRHRDRYHHCHHHFDQSIDRQSREGSGLSHDHKYIEIGRVLYDSPTPKHVNAKIAQNAHSAFTPNTSVYGDYSEHCSIK